MNSVDFTDNFVGLPSLHKHHNDIKKTYDFGVHRIILDRLWGKKPIRIKLVHRRVTLLFKHPRPGQAHCLAGGLMAVSILCGYSIKIDRRFSRK